MKNVLKPGMVHEKEYLIRREKTVPFLYPDSAAFVEMPEVFATGYMIGLMEWCCIEALAPALDPGEGSLGTYVQSTHSAATPPGGTVRVRATLLSIENRNLTWEVIAHDDLDLIGAGRIGRTVVRWDRFKAGVAQKAERIREGAGMAATVSG